MTQSTKCPANFFDTFFVFVLYFGLKTFLLENLEHRIWTEFSVHNGSWHCSLIYPALKKWKYGRNNTITPTKTSCGYFNQLNNDWSTSNHILSHTLTCQIVILCIIKWPLLEVLTWECKSVWLFPVWHYIRHKKMKVKIKNHILLQI